MAPFLSPRPLPLSVPPSPPVSHPHPPAQDPPPWTHPRSRILRPRPRVCAPFEPRALRAHLPSLSCTLSQTPSPSPSLCARNQGAPPPPTDVRRPFHGRRGTPRRVCCPSKLRPTACPPGTPLGSTLIPLVRLVLAHRSSSWTAGALPPSPRGVPVPPSLHHDSCVSP